MTLETSTLSPTPESRRQEKMARIPIKIEPGEPPLRKPEWIRIKIPSSSKITELKTNFRENRLHTVCEEAACPNLSECFSHGIATFLIMGDICTRRCTFCDIAHGKPAHLDEEEPKKLAETIAQMQLKYVVITSVDRDDLRDGGASHFVRCLKAIRNRTPPIHIEILVPDFRGKIEAALDILATFPPNVFNHNLETVPRLYKAVRPGSDYSGSLELIRRFKERCPTVPTKSGLMLGLGEREEELIEVLKDLRAHHCERLTLGQYLQPSRYHFPVKRYVAPSEFASLKKLAENLGFTHVASGPLVRSSYHAEEQAAGRSVG
ncbi:MAG: lipoyl synthase [Gammaproteobacteria bacterium]|nr:lipoyl synthase [Gammaproteobacteria bacterium]